jgi:hypothetical protein
MISSRDKLQMTSALVSGSGLTSDVLSVMFVTPGFLIMTCLRCRYRDEVRSDLTCALLNVQ